MNKILIALFAINMSGTVCGMLTTTQSKRIHVLPSEKLIEHFTNNGYAHFVEHSNLIYRVGGKECDSKGLKTAINVAFTQYQLRNQTAIQEDDVMKLKQFIDAAILQKAPRA
jgi:hypothetical protein